MKPRLTHRGLASEPLLELLLQVAQRPSSQCLHQHLHLRNTTRHPASHPTRRYFSTTSPVLEAPPPPKKLPGLSSVPTHIGLDRNPHSTSAISRIPIPTGTRSEAFTPSPLSRPLGLPHPPQPGQNSPIDRRTLSEKSRDFSSKDQALARRKILIRSFLRPYFQDWKHVDHWKGKSFVANERLFKREAALWFPNMFGSTLSEKGDGIDGGRDTTPALRGKITVVGIQSGQWAEEQVNSFLGVKENPGLHELIGEGKVQRADINAQDNWLRSLFVFTNKLRKDVPKEQWERYFRVKLVRDVGRGVTEDIRDAMGFLNSNVGYVYLLDSECKIRWAGSGHAWPGERESMNAGIRRLWAEMKGEKLRKVDVIVPKISKPEGVVGNPWVEKKRRKAMAA